MSSKSSPFEYIHLNTDPLLLKRLGSVSILNVFEWNLLYSKKWLNNVKKTTTTVFYLNVLTDLETVELLIFIWFYFLFIVSFFENHDTNFFLYFLINGKFKRI